MSHPTISQVSLNGTAHQGKVQSTDRVNVTKTYKDGRAGGEGVSVKHFVLSGKFFPNKTAVQRLEMLTKQSYRGGRQFGRGAGSYVAADSLIRAAKKMDKQQLAAPAPTHVTIKERKAAKVAIAKPTQPTAEYAKKSARCKTIRSHAERYSDNSEALHKQAQKMKPVHTQSYMDLLRSAIEYGKKSADLFKSAEQCFQSLRNAI